MEHKCASATKKQMSTATVNYFASIENSLFTAEQNNFLALIHPSVKALMKVKDNKKTYINTLRFFVFKVQICFFSHTAK